MKDFNSAYPLVMVLTLNYNQHEMTIRCVHSLLKSDYPRLRVLVVDNGSEPESAEAVKHEFGDKIEFQRIETNCGYVGGMNFALRHAAPSNPCYFLIMNNDAVIDPAAVGELVKTARRYDDKCLVTGKVYHYDRPDVLQHVGFVVKDPRYLEFEPIVKDTKDVGQFEQVEERDMVDDIFWLMPARVYQEVGGYSSYFWFNGEQADLALRAVQAGHKLVFTPGAKLWHKGSLTIGGRSDNPELVYWHVRSKLTLQFLHLKRRHFLKVYLGMILTIGTGFIKNLLKLLILRKTRLRLVEASWRGWWFFTKWMFHPSEVHCNESGKPLT